MSYYGFNPGYCGFILGLLWLFWVILDLLRVILGHYVFILGYSGFIMDLLWVIIGFPWYSDSAFILGFSGFILGYSGLFWVYSGLLWDIPSYYGLF